MKILIPVLSFGRSGGNRVLSRLADELIDLGHEVVFLCPDRNEPPYFPTKAEVRWISDQGLLKPHHNPNFSKPESGYSIQRKLTKALAAIHKSSFDAVIANHSLTVRSIVNTGWKEKTLYYVQAYEPELLQLLGGIKNRTLAFFSARSYQQGLYTVVNADVYLNYKNLRASRTLSPGIDFSCFYPKSLSNRIQNKIILGTIGRTEKYKGTQYILQAYSLLKEKYPKIELHVAFGEASDFSQYEDVKCFQPHGDTALADYYRSLDFYLCAGFSQQGAFHYPIAEAMACATAVITTRYSPATEQNSWLCDSQSADDLIKNFEAALSNSEERLRKIKQGLNDVQQFEWKLVGRKLEEYLFELVGNKVSAATKTPEIHQ
jgi:glycosyltransferase involved in cell wall biosynthesis